MKKPCAIFTSDWHIWGRPPIWRSAEPDWFKAMDRSLRQIRRYQKLNEDLPVIMPGDIFDFYNPPPEVVNWLIRKMPKNVYAIPGQHDLQNHALDLIEKTGFWTLVEAGVVHFIPANKSEIVSTISGGPLLQIASKPWGCEELNELKKSNLAEIFVFIAHQYVFKDASTSYVGADKSANISCSKEQLKEVDVAVFGDNHIPFLGKVGKTKVVNCGTMIRRKIDERYYETGFVVLYDDLTLGKIPFDISKDNSLKFQFQKTRARSKINEPQNYWRN